jgi:hypothetical protein
MSIRQKAEKFSLNKAKNLYTLNPDLQGAAIEGYRQSVTENYKKRPINLKL